MPHEEVIRRLTPVGPRAPLATREIVSIHREPVDSGAGEIPPEAQRAAKHATLGRPAVGLYQRPDWASELAHKGVSVTDMLDEVRRRVIADPHEETLVAAQMILNDIARTPEGGPLIRRYVSADLITKLIPTEDGR